MALKIIDLDIDESLSADTRVAEVGWVLQPAIETEFMYFSSNRMDEFDLKKVRDYIQNHMKIKEYEMESITDYPQYITDNAKKAQAWVDKNGYGSCMTDVGKRRLSQLANREPISLDTIKRMKAYADRHKKDLQSSKSFEDGCGLLSWMSWGLDTTGRAEKWLESKITSEENMDYDTGALPAYDNYPTGDTKNDMLIEPILFVERKPGESKDDYISRCVEYHIKNEGMEADQAYAICISKTEEFLRGDKVSFDYDDTLSTARGIGLALHEKFQGSTLYIISARSNPQGMYAAADKLGIPHSRVFATGSNERKIQKIKDLGITKHYDNNSEVIKELGHRGIQFSCPCLDEVSNAGSEMFQIMDKYNLIGFIDNQPVFSTPDMAQEYATQVVGCTGYNTTKDEDGNDVYLPCSVISDDVEIKSIGQENINVFSEFNVDDYDDEDKEAIALLKFLADTDMEKFEAVIGAMRGATETELKARNHKNPTTYFKYERVLSGSPDRDFCMSIENRYFRRFEIDLLRDTNTEFGHEKQPYSKWLYKGGPNCVHAWRKYLVQGKDFADLGMAEGRAGTPPKSMPNNGYYSPETKRKSEVAYIVSQQNSKQVFKADNEQRMIYTPLMIPNILIPRIDDSVTPYEKYYVRFKPEVIEKIRNKFMTEGRLRDTNYEHSDHKFNDIVMVESWIITGPNDKAYDLGFTKEQAPIGTWMGGYKVLDTNEGNTIWNDYVKTGLVRGASVEGEFLMRFSKQYEQNSMFGKIKTNKLF